VPTITRSRKIDAHHEALWDLIADPSHLPRWWPNVTRVEDVQAGAWTTVMATESGRPVRADYTLLSSQRPERMSWEQELEESPFERLLKAAVTDVELESADGQTVVHMTANLELRGLSRLGAMQVNRAWKRQFDAALAGLAAISEPGPGD
jgi:uncharacterized protein YndB with AHSA1/START domain